MNFSILITTYNRLGFLRRSIRSALSQSIPCQVVVADDGSSDGTEQYVCDLQKSLADRGDRRLTYHRNDRNQGHAATVNAGVQLARGEWIKCLDDDDYLHFSCIEEMQKAIALHPQAAICSCQAAQVDLKGVELSRTRVTGPGKVFYIPQEDIHYGMLLERVPFGTPTQVAFQRQAFDRSGGWDNRLKNCDDIDSWIRIARFGDAIFMNQCLAYRTVWLGGQSINYAIEERLKTNILMKQRIYALVCGERKQKLPALEHIESYLHLHWGSIALREKNIRSALHILWPAIASLEAWRLLWGAILARRRQFFGGDRRSPNPQAVRRFVLLER